MDVLPGENTSGAWFVVDEPHRQVDVGVSEDFRVRVAVPAGVPTHGCWFQARVHSTTLGLAAGAAVSARVTITVDSAPAEEHLPVSVPDVVGLDPHMALSRLGDSQLRADINGQVIHPGEMVLLDLGEGTTWEVRSQSPAAGSLVAHDSTVSLFLQQTSAPVEPVEPAIDIVFDDNKPPHW
ncbi:PASTA domain-containing protein [Solwaraspora sp. WMMD406]|uniref:PASTA domain-containing protein n=1 Tax=Solwaraspora sp. WMMD406 TaxID=3016095 RepID=UPI0024162FE5|nr:PASTA domain-containing protein [Solwaraspora sp. WMMD406]MDG4764192.1 PASTA domain-containing protein [Solwaraspora sp. WMMD406]